MRPLVRIVDTASQGISPASSVHPGGALLLATTNARTPSANMLSTLNDTSMLQHLNRGHRARNEHRAASPTIHENDLKLCGAFREASPKLQLSSAARASLRQQQPHALAASSQPSRPACVILDVEFTRRRLSGMQAASPEPLHSSRRFPLHRGSPRLPSSEMVPGSLIPWDLADGDQNNIPQ